MADKRVGIVIEGKAAVDPAFREVKKQFNLLQASGKQLGNVFTGIGQGIGQRVAGVAFDAISSVTNLFTQAVPKALAYARSIDEISDATGASAAQASVLAGTLNILGIPTDGLATTFRTLSSEIVTNEAKFNALGIQVRDSGGNLLNTVSILDNTRSALNKMGDGAAKTALAVDLFGRSALSMMDYLNLSDEAAASAALELEKMGLVLSDETVRAAEDADRSFNLLGMTVDGLQITLANQLLPSIINIVNAIRNWVMENREGLIKVLSQVAGAIAGFITGILGATNAMSGFINSLRSSGSAVDTTKAGIMAQIQALQQQRAAYAASGSGASGLGGANSKLTNEITKQIAKLREQSNALREVTRAQMEQAAAAFQGLLSGLDAAEQQYQIEQRRKELTDSIAEAEQASAEARLQYQRELNALRGERDLAMAAEADADKQFQIAVDYAQREQRLLEQQAEEATRLDKAIAEARKRLVDFELETKRQAAIAEKRARIEAAQETSQEIQKLAEADYAFNKNIAKLQQMEGDLQSQLKIARANGDSLAIQLIEIQLAQITDAIRAQQEAKEIARQQRELERQKARAAGAKTSSNAVIATIDAEIAKLKEQLLTYQNLDKNGIEPTAAENNEFQKSMEDWTQIATDVKNAFKVIGDVFNVLKFIWDITVGPIITAIGNLIGLLRTAIDLIGKLGSAKMPDTKQLYGTPTETPPGPYPPTPPKRTPTPPPTPVRIPTTVGPRMGVRAMGGPVTGQNRYLVGENGPELFVPNMSGQIIPNGVGGGGINVTIQAGAFLGSGADAREFARRVFSAMEDETRRRYTIQPVVRRGAGV